MQAQELVQALALVPELELEQVQALVPGPGLVPERAQVQELVPEQVQEPALVLEQVLVPWWVQGWDR